jgi:hypothetical protein
MIYSAWFFMSLCALIGCHTIDEGESILEIDFRDYFKNDIVSFKIDNYYIFNDLKLKSDEILGYADIYIKVFKINDHSLLIKYSDIEIECNGLSGNDIVLTVVINDIPNVFVIDVSKGKYVGFDKETDNIIYMSQRDKPFEYE